MIAERTLAYDLIKLVFHGDVEGGLWADQLRQCSLPKNWIAV